MIDENVRPLIQTIESTSSGTGTSYYLQAAKCSRKAALDKKHADIRRDIQDAPAADVGTLVHALLAYYYKRQRNDAVIQLDDSRLDATVAEANRVFSAYTQEFGPEELGEVIAVERPYPANDTDAVLMKHAVGLMESDTGYTIRPDLIVRISAADIKKFSRTRPMLALPGPGIYLVDHKTQGARGAYDALKYRYSLQFLSYQMCFNAVSPERCRGMIANVMVKHKEMSFDKSFYSIFCPEPTSIDIKAVRRFLPGAHKMAQTDVPNLASCFDFTPCHYLTSGLCDRT